MRATALASTSFDHWKEHRAQWRWRIPAQFNIADACLVRWSERKTTSSRLALKIRGSDDFYKNIDYSQFYSDCQNFLGVLANCSITKNERVAIYLPQRYETAIALLATLMRGAVAVPLTVLFGPDALAYRLKNASCKAIVCDTASLANVLAVRDQCPELREIFVCDSKELERLPPGVRSFEDELANAVPIAHCEATLADDPALIIYTSGTTGPPKGALIPHRAMFGNMSGFLYSHNLRSDPAKALEDVEPFVFWSPADWAWTGGLWDALLPTLFLGQTIVGYRGRFDPIRAFELMEKFEVTSTFLFPTALKMMMKAVPKPREQYNLKLRSIMSAGESVGETVFSWTRDALGVTTNEMFGQTELNYIVGNSHELWPAKPGSMGRGYPGHQVAIVDHEGNTLPAGSTGDVAVNRYDIHGDPVPVFFLGYLNNETATRDKYSGDWCRTGDMARIDEDGYLWYEGRSDDVIKSSGYRIGPAEVESCLIQHPAVAMAAVIGKPDAERGAIVKAFIVLSDTYVKSGGSASKALEDELALHVRGKLAPYEYPKEFEFVNELPMTTTGKIQRKVLREREALKTSTHATN
ncbi:MAG: acyl-CoA synthetase [Casimicrobium sp.]